MIKKIFFTLIAFLLAAALSACASSRTLRTGNNTGNTSQNVVSNTGTGSLSLEEKLAVGTLKLEGTAQAVTPQEAKDLLFLWKAAKSLPSSNNTSQDEITALYQQIEETMTSEQVQAVQNMTLNTEEISSLKQDYAIESSAQGGQANATSGEQGSQNQRRNQGGFLDDGPPGGGQGFPGGGMMGSQTQRTPVAGQSSNRSSQDLNALFAGALIKLLETRAGE